MESCCPTESPILVVLSSLNQSMTIWSLSSPARRFAHDLSASSLTSQLVQSAELHHFYLNLAKELFQNVLDRDQADQLISTRLSYSLGNTIYIKSKQITFEVSSRDAQSFISKIFEVAVKIAKKKSSKSKFLEF